MGIRKLDVAFGWVPDVPDRRDLRFAMPPLKSLPGSASLKRWCSPVEDQRTLGSCTANAGVGAMEYLMNRNKRKFFDLSRLFLYYNTRMMQGTPGYDSGASIRGTIKAMANFGVCPEADWPYDIEKFKTRPSIMCYAKGLGLQIEKYERLNSLDEMKACLADGFPFLFGFSVYESFMSSGTAKTGKAAMPKSGEKLLGGHAVLAVGYSDRSRRIAVRNSWGPNWGARGYFTMPYAYLENRDLSDDFWTVRAGEQI